MQITIFGGGYVGLTQAACFAHIGHSVCCVEINEERVAHLNAGIVPIHEPGLDILIKENLSNHRLSFTTDVQTGLKFGEIIMIAVGTPPKPDGAANLEFVFSVADTIAHNILEKKVIFIKSTVPVGTADRVKERIQAILTHRNLSFNVEAVSNPEFLKEGTAVNDCLYPERIIIGSDGTVDLKIIFKLYRRVGFHENDIIFMDNRSAELTKYAANSMLATKISFINEIANIAERLGANIDMVRKGIGSDSRIGNAFISPGCGYGGSCFPKDVQALSASAREAGYEPKLLSAVEKLNESQKLVLFEKIIKHYNNEIKGKIFAVWGLAFKPKTDDMRDAPSRVLIEALLASGAKIQAFDPAAFSEAIRIYGSDRQDLLFVKNKEAALVGVDALVILTEWIEFQEISTDALKKALKDLTIFDGRNIFQLNKMKAAGINYYSIGRPTISKIA